MQRAIQIINQFKSKVNLEQVYNVFVVFIISIILILSAIALFRPISPERVSHVVTMAKEPIYPETQEMALALLSQRQISLGQYLKLVQAHQVELTRAKQLPPVSGEEY
jgi:hypothetical protein